MSQQTLPVSGLTCHRCTETVTEQLTAIPGVSSVSIDLVTGGVSQVQIESETEIDDATAQAALTEGGAFSIAR